tara:strand:- start:982 stop:2136 length:1155 start_codon:yes stop_codon:yes gene_type:complete
MTTLKQTVTKLTCIEKIRKHIFNIEPSDVTNIEQMPPEDIVVFPITNNNPSLKYSIDKNIKDYLITIHSLGLLKPMVDYAINTLRIMSDIKTSEGFDTFLSNDRLAIYIFFGQLSLIKDKTLSNEDKGRVLISTIIRKGQYLDEYISKYKQLLNHKKYTGGSAHSKSRYLSRKNNKSQTSYKKKTQCKKQLKYGGNLAEKEIKVLLQIFFRRNFIYSAITYKEKTEITNDDTLIENIQDSDLQLWLEYDHTTKNYSITKDIRLFASISDKLCVSNKYISKVACDPICSYTITDFYENILRCKTHPKVQKILAKKRSWFNKAMKTVGIAAALAGIIYVGTKVHSGNLNIASVNDDFTRVSDTIEDRRVRIRDSTQHLTISPAVDR